MGVEGFPSVGSAEEEGAQGAQPGRQGAVKEVVSSLSQPSHRADRWGPSPGCFGV